ncbi:MEMO1 family protein [Halalkaliarchaeum desulfuricum]|uniref:MEMO1 family protein AArcSl_1009 n=1 Tax=Halalkaliarchaeum desulfuricum TaxID=2055893 RepID=A0A343THS5_9EURY|nr:AmmeMemoRadiSam system protein B [Halalkaliarchaeum desulfuricum]AUX08647.1 MEMO1 family protein [Halalkaliarchaeum desulfuricum]
MTDVRQPAVAGEFYRGDPAALKEQIEACFTNEHGPGTVPETEAKRESDPRSGESRSPQERLLGLVVPHAGYPYSGPIAAHSYAALARSWTPETAVVLGPNHRQVGAEIALPSHDAWETPLGTLPVDDRLRDELLGTAEAIRIDDRAHGAEHAVEVQLPFLQQLEATSRILPVSVATRERSRCESLGEAIARAIDAIGRDAVVIASTDLTHYEPPEAATAADEPVLDLLADLDPVGLLDHVERTAHTMCGPGATAATLSAGSRLGAESGTVYAYATSADTATTGGRTVGYAAAGIDGGDA